MDPISLGGLGLASTALGAGVSAFGNLTQGNSQSQQFQYQAGMAQLNKKIALQNADYSREVGDVQAQESGLKTKALLGGQKAAQAGSGLDVNKGSTEDVRTSTEELGQYDQSLIRANAAKKAYGYEVGAAQDEAQSNLYKLAGENATKAGKIAAFGSILGGASSVASKWLQGNQQGLWGSSKSKVYDPDSGG